MNGSSVGCQLCSAPNPTREQHAEDPLCVDPRLLCKERTCCAQRSETERLVTAFERSDVAAEDADTLARLTMRAALHSIDRCATC